MSPTAMAHALNASLRQSMDDDSKVLLIGQDIGALGGVFRITDGLQKDFGEDRVVTSPLGEAGIVGSAIGLALAGYRPVCEIQFDGFVFPAMNQIITRSPSTDTAQKGKCHCLLSSASPSVAASARLSTTASPPRLTSRTRPGCASCTRRTPRTPTTC